MTTCTSCPHCSATPYSVDGRLVCPNGHRFTACPVCRDTRILSRESDRFTVVCIGGHPYHTCPKHGGIVRGRSRNDGECTCEAERMHVQKVYAAGWEKPFL